MAIPISYNIRNLRLRKSLTIMTALGIALTVTTALFIMALLAGLQKAFKASGNPLNVMVVRKGSTSELTGPFASENFPVLKTLPGIAKDSHGEPMVSGETVVVIVLPRADGSGEVNVSVRGMMQDGLELRSVKLAQGRWFTPGQREVVVSTSIHKRFLHANVGDTMEFGKGVWQVVGVFDSGGTAYESEVWGDVNQMNSDFDRQGVYSSAYMRATDAVAADALKNRVSDDQRLKLDGMIETEYYAKQTSSGTAIKFIGLLVGIIMAIGSSFAAMNTMYAAVARRAKEVGTLRVLGFPQRSILASFFLESMILSLVGGVLGCILVLPLNGLTTGILSQTTFSEIAFHFRTGPESLGIGIAFALVMGAIGGLLPARMAARKEILAALRDL